VKVAKKKKSREPSEARRQITTLWDYCASKEPFLCLIN
jgi:hypothetical protein